jgi:hypothetical protein
MGRLFLLAGRSRSRGTFTHQLDVPGSSALHSQAAACLAPAFSSPIAIATNRRSRACCPILRNSSGKVASRSGMTSRSKCGERWHEEIEPALDGASIAVVLISQQFLASDFVHHEELPRILLRQLEGRMSVLPVFISPSTVRSDFIEISDHEGRKRRIVLAEFQGFGTPDYPLSDLPLPERQHRFVALAHRIHELSGDGEPIHGPHRIATRPSVTHERDLESKLPALSNAGSAVIDIAGFWDLREWPIPPRSSSVQALNVSRGYLALVRSDLGDRWAG